MPTAITVDDIAEAANSPQSATADGQSVTDRSIEDKIKGFNFTTEQEAGATNKSAWHRVRMARAVPPGAT